MWNTIEYFIAFATAPIVFTFCCYQYPHVVKPRRWSVMLSAWLIGVFAAGFAVAASDLLYFQ
jgi:peptidoglycan biosynthesis protein MviN/MurJ (putative lipid II flippase)